MNSTVSVFCFQAQLNLNIYQSTLILLFGSGSRKFRDWKMCKGVGFFPVATIFVLINDASLQTRHLAELQLSTVQQRHCCCEALDRSDSTGARTGTRVWAEIAPPRPAYIYFFNSLLPSFT